MSAPWRPVQFHPPGTCLALRGFFTAPCAGAQPRHHPATSTQSPLLSWVAARTHGTRTLARAPRARSTAPPPRRPAAPLPRGCLARAVPRATLRARPPRAAGGVVLLPCTLSQTLAGHAPTQAQLVNTPPSAVAVEGCTSSDHAHGLFCVPGSKDHPDVSQHTEVESLTHHGGCCAVGVAMRGRWFRRHCCLPVTGWRVSTSCVHLLAGPQVKRLLQSRTTRAIRK